MAPAAQSGGLSEADMGRSAESKYVAVRRHLIFFGHSMHEGIQWVVFEPNGRRPSERPKPRCETHATSRIYFVTGMFSFPIY